MIDKLKSGKTLDALKEVQLKQGVEKDINTEEIPERKKRASVTFLNSNEEQEGKAKGKEQNKEDSGASSPSDPLKLGDGESSSSKRSLVKASEEKRAQVISPRVLIVLFLNT